MQGETPTLIYSIIAMQGETPTNYITNEAGVRRMTQVRIIATAGTQLGVEARQNNMT